MKCEGCGCTDQRACAGGCYWVRPGICSSCFELSISELVDAALDWKDRGAAPTHTNIAGRTGQIEVGEQFMLVRDHLGVVIFKLDPEGVEFMPHYDPAELLPLFA